MNNNSNINLEGFYFPAEWETHEATWLSFPHKEASWPGKLDSVYAPYCQFINEVAKAEKVCINVTDAEMQSKVNNLLLQYNGNADNVFFFHHPTNDAWCRDHGPAFLINKQQQQKLIIDWDYNAWGNKYPPYDLDDIIPTLIAKQKNIPVVYPKIVMEGGSVEFNGNGTLLTSKSCLLNPNRNPHLSQEQIENYLRQYYRVEQILWISDGIVGDDTDGHIDDTVRFVNEDTVLTVVETDKLDDNYHLLQTNLKELQAMRILNGKQLNIIELPMPKAVEWEGQRLPASYANFYICNNAVIVPTYRDKNDDKALQIIANAFKHKKVIGIDSWDVIWGLGSWHCLSQQEPLL